MNNVFETLKFTVDNILVEDNILYINLDGKRWYVGAFAFDHYYFEGNTLYIRHSIFSVPNFIDICKDHTVFDSDFGRPVNFVEYAKYLGEKGRFASPKIMKRLAELNEEYGIVSEVVLKANGHEYIKTITIGHNYDYLKKSLRNQDVNLINGVLFYDIGLKKMVIAVGVDDYSITYGDDIVYWGKDGYKFRAAIYGNTVAYKKDAEWEWENFEVCGVQDKTSKIVEAAKILDVARVYQLYIRLKTCNLFDNKYGTIECFNAKIIDDTFIINPTGNKWYAVLHDVITFNNIYNGYIVYCNDGYKYKVLFNSKNDKPTIDIFAKKDNGIEYEHVSVLDIDELLHKSKFITNCNPKVQFALSYLNKDLPGERKWVCKKKSGSGLDRLNSVFNACAEAFRLKPWNEMFGKEPLTVEIDTDIFKDVEYLEREEKGWNENGK